MNDSVVNVYIDENGNISNISGESYLENEIQSEIEITGGSHMQLIKSISIILILVIVTTIVFNSIRKKHRGYKEEFSENEEVLVHLKIKPENIDRVTFYKGVKRLFTFIMKDGSAKTVNLEDAEVIDKLRKELRDNNLDIEIIEEENL